MAVPFSKQHISHDHKSWLQQYSKFRSTKTRDGTRNARSMRISIRKQTQCIVQNRSYSSNDEIINLPEYDTQIELIKIDSQHIDDQKSKKTEEFKFNASNISILNNNNIIDWH